MTDLTTAITALKASMDRMPRDTSTRPFYAALVACFEAVDERTRERSSVEQEALEHANWHNVAPPLPPKRVGWPKGKPRKPVVAPESVA